MTSILPNILTQLFNFNYKIDLNYYKYNLHDYLNDINYIFQNKNNFDEANIEFYRKTFDELIMEFNYENRNYEKCNLIVVIIQLTTSPISLYLANESIVYKEYIISELKKFREMFKIYHMTEHLDYVNNQIEYLKK